MKESRPGPPNVRLRMRLTHHCCAPPLGIQPSQAPAVLHVGGAWCVGARAGSWGDYRASTANRQPVRAKICRRIVGSKPRNQQIGASSTSLHDQHRKLFQKYVHNCVSLLLLSCCASFLHATFFRPAFDPWPPHRGGTGTHPLPLR